jgi:hypothetical protein
MKKHEIYVEITTEKERLKAIEILKKSGESIYARCSLKEKNNFGKLTMYHDGEWICSCNLSAKKTEITLSQLEEMLMPKSEMKQQTAVEWLVANIDWQLLKNTSLHYEMIVNKAKEMERKEKIKHQLFIGKVYEIIGFKKTVELLRECNETFNQ